MLVSTENTTNDFKTCPKCSVGLMLLPVGTLASDAAMQMWYKYGKLLMTTYKYNDSSISHYLHVCDICQHLEYYNQKFTKNIYE